MMDPGSQSVSGFQSESEIEMINPGNRQEDIKSKKVQTEPRVRDILFEKYGFWVVPTLICAPFRNVPNENNFKLIKFYQKYAQK